MKNNILAVAVSVILLGLFFILHSFIPVFADQLRAAAVTIEQIFTWLTIGVGAITATAYYFLGKKHRLLGTSIGAMIAAMGLLIFFKPAVGTLVFNGVLVALLLASGVFKLWHFRRIQTTRLKIVTAVAGVVSLAVAVIISVYFFSTAKYELLSFLALDIVMSGVVLWHLAFNKHD